MRTKLLIGGALIVVAAAYLISDVALSPLATSYVETVTKSSPAQSRSYRILYGMSAAEEDDAYEVGSKIVDDYKAAAVDASVFERNADIEDIIANPIAIPTSDENALYCKLSDGNCLTEIVLDEGGRHAEKIRLASVAERYSLYLSADDYKTELEPAADEPWPNFRYLFVGSRLHLFKAIGAIESGNADTAIEMLLGENLQLRQSLAVSDSVIHKMITVALLRDNLEAIAFLHSNFDLPTMGPLSFLSVQERSFERPLHNEFLWVYRIVQEIDSSPSELSDELDIPVWLRKLVFGPNRVLNVVAEGFEEQIELSVADAAEFADRVVDYVPVESSYYSVLPVINDAMIEMTDANYTDYIARTFDLNTKIALVNAQITGETDSLSNPYYPGEEVALHVDDDDLNVCMDGPLPDEKHYRCLDIMGVNESLVSRVNQ